jgi:hypothetical protein
LGAGEIDRLSRRDLRGGGDLDGLKFLDPSLLRGGVTETRLRGGVTDLLFRGGEIELRLRGGVADGDPRLLGGVTERESFLLTGLNKRESRRFGVNDLVSDLV